MPGSESGGPDHFYAEHICRKGQTEATLVSHTGSVFSKGSVRRKYSSVVVSAQTAVVLPRAHKLEEH